MAFKAELGERDKKMLLILGIVAVIFCGVYFVIFPQWNSVQAVSKKAADDKAQRDDLEAKYKNIDNLKKELTKNQKELKKFEQQIPENLNIEDAIYKINDILKKAQVSFSEGNIQVQDIAKYTPAQSTMATTTTATVDPGFYKISMVVTLKGRYPNMYKMAKGIEECPLKMNVANINFNDQAQVITGQLTIELYTFNPTGKLPELKQIKKLPDSKANNIFAVEAAKAIEQRSVALTIQPNTGGNGIKFPSTVSYYTF